MTMLARDFGVELEGACGNVNACPSGWETAYDSSVRGIEADQEECVHCDIHGDVWNVVSRRYRRCQNCNGRHYITHGQSLHPVELVSPRLRDLGAIDSAYEYISQYGWGINESHGLHVHVDCTGVRAKAIRRIVMLSAMVEPLFYGMNDESRWEGSYAKPMSYMHKNVINEGQHIDHGELSEAIYGSYYELRRVNKYMEERYYGLNLHSYFLRETIEFRYFMGSPNAEYAKQRVELCVKMVDFAINASEEQLLTVITHLDQASTFDSRWAVLREVLDLGYTIDAYQDSTGEAHFQRALRHLRDEGILSTIHNLIPFYNEHPSERRVAERLA